MDERGAGAEPGAVHGLAVPDDVYKEQNIVPIEVEIVSIEVTIVPIEVEIVSIEVTIVSIEVKIVSIEVEIVSIEMKFVSFEGKIVSIGRDVVSFEMDAVRIDFWLRASYDTKFTPVPGEGQEEFVSQSVNH